MRTAAGNFAKKARGMQEVGELRTRERREREPEGREEHHQTKDPPDMAAKSDADDSPKHPVVLWSSDIGRDYRPPPPRPCNARVSTISNTA